MNNVIEEYKKQFKPETLELIVRIRWCWEKGSSNFKMLGDCYKAEVQIDRALNVKTGELYEVRMRDDTIVWLAPKKIFGFKYGYKFKTGNIYRVLVRECDPMINLGRTKYYLEQVLEEDVHEPRLDSLYNFENKFEEKVTDLLVLVKDGAGGGVIDSKYKHLGVTFIASIDPESNELNQSYGTLAWMQEVRKSNIKFKLDKLEAYLVRVRKSKENNNRYMLLDVVKKVMDDRFEYVKKEYLKPVVIKNEIGEFKLDRDFVRFEGAIDYLGNKSSVMMFVGEGETTAEVQLNKLREIISDLESWDNKVKKYASQKLLELANDWSEDDVEITEEEFIQRIGWPDIVIHPDGSVEVWFESDNMFTDHAIVIHIDENGNFEEAEIAG